MNNPTDPTALASNESWLSMISHFGMLRTDRLRSVSSHIRTLPFTRTCGRTKSLAGIHTGICRIANCVGCLNKDTLPTEPSQPPAENAAQSTAVEPSLTLHQLIPNLFHRQAHLATSNSDRPLRGSNPPTQRERFHLFGDDLLPELVNGRTAPLAVPLPFMVPSLLVIFATAAALIPWSRLNLRF